MNDTSLYGGSEDAASTRRAQFRRASATAQTLSAVPMSTRLTFRCAGTVAKWMTPGVSRTGIDTRASARIERTQSADASRLAFGGEEREPEIRVRQIARRGERQPVAGGPDDEIDRRGLLEEIGNT